MLDLDWDVSLTQPDIAPRFRPAGDFMILLPVGIVLARWWVRKECWIPDGDLAG